MRASARRAADPRELTQSFYEVHAREYFDRTVSVDLSLLYERVLKWVRPSGCILDVGCGSGRDLKVFRSRGFDAVGIDASKALVKLASEFSETNCLPIRLEDLDFEDSFDAVWACASLLHVSKDRILDVLRRINRALVAGGVLFASVQAGEGEKMAADGRFFAYYSPEEFARLLREAGFAPDDLWTSEDLLSDRTGVQWINVIAHREKNPFASPASQPRRICP